MKKEQLKRFKKLFDQQKRSILYNDRVIREDFQVDENDKFDELDQASTVVEQSLRMRLRNRENHYIKTIEQALQRIDSGEFGICESCDCDIEIKRLEARPTATMCIQCQEEEEHKERTMADGSRFISHL